MEHLVVRNDLYTDCKTDNKLIFACSLLVNGKKYDIKIGENTIGRSPKSDIFIDSCNVSVHQASIEWAATDEHLIFIYATNSDVTTKLSKTKLKPFVRYQLTDGNKISFGNIQCVFNMRNLPSLNCAKPDILAINSLPTNGNLLSSTNSYLKSSEKPDLDYGDDFYDAATQLPICNTDNVNNASLNSSDIFNQDTQLDISTPKRSMAFLESDDIYDQPTQCFPSLLPQKSDNNKKVTKVSAHKYLEDGEDDFLNSLNLSELPSNPKNKENHSKSPSGDSESTEIYEPEASVIEQKGKVERPIKATLFECPSSNSRESIQKANNKSDNKELSVLTGDINNAGNLINTFKIPANNVNLNSSTNTSCRLNIDEDDIATQVFPLAVIPSPLTNGKELDEDEIPTQPFPVKGNLPRSDFCKTHENKISDVAMAITEDDIPTQIFPSRASTSHVAIISSKDSRKFVFSSIANDEDDIPTQPFPTTRNLPTSNSSKSLEKGLNVDFKAIIEDDIPTQLFPSGASSSNVAIISTKNSRKFVSSRIANDEDDIPTQPFPVTRNLPGSSSYESHKIANKDNKLNNYAMAIAEDDIPTQIFPSRRSPSQKCIKSSEDSKINATSRTTNLDDDIPTQLFPGVLVEPKFVSESNGAGCDPSEADQEEILTQSLLPHSTKNCSSVKNDFKVKGGGSTIVKDRISDMDLTGDETDSDVDIADHFIPIKTNYVSSLINDTDITNANGAGEPDSQSYLPPENENEGSFDITENGANTEKSIHCLEVPIINRISKPSYDNSFQSRISMGSTESSFTNDSIKDIVKSAINTVWTPDQAGNASNSKTMRPECSKRKHSSSGNNSGDSLLLIDRKKSKKVLKSTSLTHKENERISESSDATDSDIEEDLSNNKVSVRNFPKHLSSKILNDADPHFPNTKLSCSTSNSFSSKRTNTLTSPQTSAQNSSERDFCSFGLGDCSQEWMPLTCVARHTRSSVTTATPTSKSKQKSQSLRNCSKSSITEASNNKKPLSVLQGENNMKIAFTGGVTSQVLTYTRSLGGIETDMEQASVLVCDHVIRTVKLLSAVAQGKPVASCQWVFDSKTAQSWLDPWDYIIEDVAAERRWGFSMKKTLKKVREKPLFSGYYIAASQNTKPPPSDILNIGRLAGATALAEVPSSWPSPTLYITTQNDRSTWPDKSKNVKCLNTEFFMCAILQYRLTYKPYLLRQN